MLLGRFLNLCASVLHFSKCMDFREMLGSLALFSTILLKVRAFFPPPNGSSTFGVEI